MVLKIVQAGTKPADVNAVFFKKCSKLYIKSGSLPAERSSLILSIVKLDNYWGQTVG